jgi:hypothetical protein
MHFIPTYALTTISWTTLVLNNGLSSGLENNAAQKAYS